jgi:hypothetical protein
MNHTPGSGVIIGLIAGMILWVGIWIACFH